MNLKFDLINEIKESNLSAGTKILLSNLVDKAELEDEKEESDKQLLFDDFMDVNTLEVS